MVLGGPRPHSNADEGEGHTMAISCGSPATASCLVASSTMVGAETHRGDYGMIDKATASIQSSAASQG